MQILFARKITGGILKQILPAHKISEDTKANPISLLALWGGTLKLNLSAYKTYWRDTKANPASLKDLLERKLKQYLLPCQTNWGGD